MAKRSFKRQVRSKTDAPRYPNGRLKPPEPNAKVITERRRILGLSHDAPATADELRRAENAVDVALARGWITGAQHRAVQAYAHLVRAELGRLPLLRGAALQETAAPAALRVSEEGLDRTGVITEADTELLRKAADMDAGRITPREYAMAVRRHRTAKIDWSRMPSADIAKLMDAIMDATPPMRGEPEHEQHSELRRIWAQVSPSAARDLFDLAVIGSWPSWIVALINGRALTKPQADSFNGLLDALDVAAGVFAKPRPVVEAPAQPGPRQAFADRPSARREEYIAYVTPDGAPAFEVVKRYKRRPVAYSNDAS